MAFPCSGARSSLGEVCPPPSVCPSTPTLLQLRLPCHWADSSPVFAEMLTLAANSSESVTLQLDAEFEDHETLHHFLVLVTDQAFEADGFPGGEFWDWRFPLHHLLSFLDKWGCERCVSSLRSIGTSAIMRGELRLTSAFVFCALLNDLAAAHGCILRYARHWCAYPVQDEYNSDLILGMQVGSMFTLAENPYGFFCVLPPAYAFGLMRANVDFKPYTEQEDDFEVESFADMFVKATTAALEAERRRELLLCSLKADYRTSLLRSLPWLPGHRPHARHQAHMSSIVHHSRPADDDRVANGKLLFP